MLVGYRGFSRVSILNINRVSGFRYKLLCMGVKAGFMHVAPHSVATILHSVPDCGDFEQASLVLGFRFSVLGYDVQGRVLITSECNCERRCVEWLLW